jgi:agmatine deiminase
MKKLLEQLFPERKIIQINPLAINRGGGGIHCATQQQPKRK